mmetsp:Transcript_6378/g.12675  ORF Transcript_6378/g.12675 Transcript_6378/m.12675 type:complete len:197 (+) Transcript_6378:80-670(+)
MAPHDVFCQRKMDLCVGLMDECLGFKDKCAGTEEDSKCCQCSFIDCPLEDAGCKMIARKCFSEGPDMDVFFSSYDAIDRVDREAQRNGKKIRRVNRNPKRHRTIAFDPTVNRIAAPQTKKELHNSTLTEALKTLTRNSVHMVEFESEMEVLRSSEMNLTNLGGNPNSTSEVKLPKRISEVGVGALDMSEDSSLSHW